MDDDFEPEESPREYRAEPTVSDEELLALEQERGAFDESEAQQASRIFRQNLILAAQTICKLAREATSEKLRSDCARYVVERNIGRIQDNPPAPVSDPLEALLKNVMANEERDNQKVT